MSALRRYIPLAAGPLLLVLFLLTGRLVGPGFGDGPSPTVYEKARLLQKRSDTLRRAEALLRKTDEYLGTVVDERGDRAPVDPREAWAGLVEELSGRAFTWREIEGEEGGPLFELRMSGPYGNVHELLAAVDRRSAALVVRELEIHREGPGVVGLLIRVSPAAGEGEAT